MCSSDLPADSVQIQYATIISAWSVAGTPAALSSLLPGARTLTLDTGSQTYATGPGTQAPVNYDLSATSDIQLLDTAVSHSDLSQFLGTGDLSVGFATDTTIAQIDSYFSSDVGVLVGASLNVTYYYHDIPEPASLALIGLGAIGAATLRRRRAKAA